MSSTTSFNFSPLAKNNLVARHRSHSCVPKIITIISKHEYCNWATHHLHPTSVTRRGRALNAAPPVSPIPSGSPSSGWSKWMLLTVIPLIFSLSKGKWGPLLVIKQQLDKTLATVDVMADVIEDIAEKVDNMADDISEKLPEGSSLKNAIDLVGDLAEKTDKAAECVDGLLEKVQDAEDKVDVMADVIEDIAEKVDNMADDISENLPEGSSLKNAIDLVGDLAEKTDKAAECVDDLLEKVQDAEDKVEKLIEESATEKAKEESSDTPEVQ